MNEDRLAEILVVLIIIAVFVLKLTNVINVSWWIIFSPLLFLLGLGCIMAIALTIAFIISLCKGEK